MKKYEELQDIILRKIRTGELKNGDILPSRNLLAKLYSCSIKTVENALRPLREKGILLSVKGGKTRIAGKNFSSEKFPAVENIFIVLGPTMMDFSSVEIRETFLPSLEDTIRIHCFREDKILRYIDLMSQASSAVIWALPGWNMVWHMQYLEKWNIPQLLLNRDYFHYSNAMTDHGDSLRKALGFFRKNKCRQLALISDEPDGRLPYIQPRVTAFFAQCAAMKFQLKENLIFLEKFSSSQEEISRVGRTLFEGKTPEGIVVLNETLLMPLLACSHIFGKIPGKDYFLLAYGDSENFRNIPGLVLIRQQHEKIFHEADRWIKEGFAAERRYFTSRIPAGIWIGNSNMEK